MTPLITVALLAQAIGFAFGFGALLLGILTVLPGSRSVARQLWPVLASEAAILAVGVLPWLLPRDFLLPLILIAAARIGYESGCVHGVTAGRNFNAGYLLALVAASGLAWFMTSAYFLPAAAFLAGVALAATRLTAGKSVIGSLARFSVFPLLPLAAFSHAAHDADSAPLLVLAFFLVEILDSFSLLGGKLLGRTPLVPRLSPRKTWEGLATGLSAMLIAVLSLAMWLDLPLLQGLVACGLVAIAAIAGDLLGSLAKRHAGVKDYPAVMTVQGGLLDIADSWIVAGPCLVGFFALLGWR
ncbi:MAG: phosphatidate cytidylyltransferase [Aestuariivirga sp.]|uniref:phosphatidate cytidylyltransferase n=1 Tax=Aestuariivirga sp. TaxID=2650926 RepID=UPI0025BA636A|nr:phosphatidate cytidylyltransferase [Aestuariivirga sp.]MCA3561695.1 phosphatidate cytidylyltransferase [Aestuariivirga sp.]